MVTLRMDSCNMAVRANISLTFGCLLFRQWPARNRTVTPILTPHAGKSHSIWGQTLHG